MTTIALYQTSIKLQLVLIHVVMYLWPFIYELSNRPFLLKYVISVVLGCTELPFKCLAFHTCMHAFERVINEGIPEAT